MLKDYRPEHQESPNKFNLVSPTKKGLIIGMILVLLSLFLYYVVHMPLNEKDQYILYAVYLAGIIWSMLSFKQIHAENKSFKDYFSTGFKTFIVVTLIMVVYTFIFFTFDTHYRDTGIAQNNALLIQEGNHTAAEIENNAKQIKQLFMPVMIGITTFKYLILGALISAVTAGFLSREKQ